MHVRLTFILSCALMTSSFAVRAGQPYVVTEQDFGNLWRVEDVNGDGDALDVGERTLWGETFEQAIGLESFEGAILATDIATALGGVPDDKILRYVDLNGDGDALDVGEREIWADGLYQPVDIVPDGAGGVFVTELLRDQVVRLTDVNGDGDALDVGETVVFADGMDGPTFFLSMGDSYLVAASNTDELYSLTDLNGDGDALDVGEKVVVLDNLGLAFGAFTDGSGGFYYGALLESTVYHAQDKNGDGDFFDVAEVLSYADDVFGDVSTPWNLRQCEEGGFLIADRNTLTVRWARDVNGDGDALDVGEVTVFADGIAGGPFDIVALSQVYNADYNENGTVDGLDFLKWQRGESPQPFSAFDLQLWEAQYGTTFSTPAVELVPEPVTAFQLLVALSLCVSRRGRRR